jgi:hypothetical protein
MSSWANRKVVSKRNLSQIPEELRPQIVSRAERPEVVLSESFQRAMNSDFESSELIQSDQFDKFKQFNQTSQKNEIIYPNSKGPVKTAPANKPSLLEINNSSGSATELNYGGQTYVFVILRHIEKTTDNNLWITSYNSIRKFYRNKIIIIDDNSVINTLNGKLQNADVIYSEFDGAGEILPYHYFLKNKWADRMIFLHDSMFLQRPFRDTELDAPVRFHWEFDKSEAYDQKKISIHLSLLKNNEKLLEYIKNPANVWKGCFGGASICDLKVVEELEETYNLFSVLPMSIKTRNDRMLFERILGIILFSENRIDRNCSNFGNIVKYPMCFESVSINNAFSLISQANYNTAIVKAWRGR